MMLDALLRRHNDPKPGSTLPQAERSGTPGGVGAMGSIDDGMGRHPCHGRHRQSNTRRPQFCDSGFVETSSDALLIKRQERTRGGGDLANGWNGWP